MSEDSTISSPGARTQMPRRPRLSRYLLAVMLCLLAVSIPLTGESRANAADEPVFDEPEKKPIVVDNIPDQDIPEDVFFELDVSVYFDDPAD